MNEKPLKKIAVIDDDQDTLTIVRIALKTLTGVEVTCYLSGEEALKELPSFSPDMVLVDIMMPGMDGITTLQHLKKEKALKETLFLFFTAKVTESEIDKYKKLGVVDVILKPFDPLTLGNKLLTMWQNNSQ